MRNKESSCLMGKLVADIHPVLKMIPSALQYEAEPTHFICQFMMSLCFV